MKIGDRLKHAWNAFTNDDQTLTYQHSMTSSRPMHKKVVYNNATSYVSSLYNRIAIDVAMSEFKHVKIDADTEDVKDIKSGLQDCLSIESNIDQTSMQLFHDIVYSMFDEGVVAVVPVETSIKPNVSGSYDIKSLRTGKIVTWFPKHVEVEVYNEHTGQNQRVTLEKKFVAIIENPLYAVVNDNNSTLKRLIRKLNELDRNESDSSAGRLDLLISVPYSIKTKMQRAMAEERIKDIEAQLATGRNGIAYIDGSEKITQLNRPATDQLAETVRELSVQFHNQLGMTENILNGTASETELRTYYNRTIDPIIQAIVLELRRKFISKRLRDEGYTIVSYRDMFKTVPVETIVKLGDTFRRNSIASSNEIRRIIGFKTSNDPKADELFNPNIADKNQTPNDEQIQPEDI